MEKNIKVRAIVAAIVTLAGIFYLMPSLTSSLPALWKNYVDKIHLGLDLRTGGECSQDSLDGEASSIQTPRSGQRFHDIHPTGEPGGT